MFGMGFMEIFLILIVAIIALGPEKLPGAIVDTVKFFKKIKNEISDAKSSIDKELDLSGMKEEAEQLKESVTNIKEMANIDINEIGQINSSPTLEELTQERKIKEEPAAVEEPLKEKKKSAKIPKKKEKILMSEGKKA